MTHAGIASLAEAQIERLGVGCGSRVLQFASPGFDASVSELCDGRCAGGAGLVVAAGRDRWPVPALADLVAGLA